MIQHMLNGEKYKKMKSIIFVFKMNTLRSFYVLNITVNYHFRIVFDVINMLQGVWIFVLFIIFNPEAKGLFCGTATTRPETDVQMDVMEGKDLVNKREN